MSNGHQNYANHRRLHPLFHFVYSLLALGLVILSLIQLVRSVQSGTNLLPAAILMLISIIVVIVFLLVRSYPLKAQDRAIRAEENLRHYVLTQKLLDTKLTMGQITALRFASDQEFPALCKKAAAEQLSPDAIKKSIKSWRSDNYRI
jgi:predicted ferric reductase